MSEEFNRADQQSGLLRTAMQRRADGGGIGALPGRIIPDRFFGGGLIGGSGFGRTDTAPLSVPSGSHVIPADVTSALGQHNNPAGSNAIQSALSAGPYGTKLPKMIKGPGPTHAHHMGMAAHLGMGGHGRSTSILAAAGEHVVPPDEVEALGHRAIQAGMAKKNETAADAGHRLLDEMIHRVRKYVVQWTLHAAPPKK